MKTEASDDGRGTISATGASRRRFVQAGMTTSAGAGLYALAPSTALAAQQGSSQQQMPAAMQAAIKACLDCHAICLHTAMNYCVEENGRHVGAAHLRLMLNCAELCQTSANFMLSNSPLHGRVCSVCAEACEACARSCEEVGGMPECRDECLRCAKSCRSMA